MNGPSPHFVLMSGSTQTSREVANRSTAGRWRFVLKSVDTGQEFVVEDREPGVRGERLELLAVVRGLEALGQPSRVTLLTGSRYVSRGLTEGLENWRENRWRWERFGKWVPVRDRDLWRRVDRALKFHTVECRRWRMDRAHAGLGRATPRAAAPRGGGPRESRAAVRCEASPDRPRHVRRRPLRGRAVRGHDGPLEALHDLCRRGVSGIVAGLIGWGRTGDCR